MYNNIMIMQMSQINYTEKNINKEVMKFLDKLIKEFLNIYQEDPHELYDKYKESPIIECIKAVKKQFIPYIDKSKLSFRYDYIESLQKKLTNIKCLQENLITNTSIKSNNITIKADELGIHDIIRSIDDHHQHNKPQVIQNILNDLKHLSQLKSIYIILYEESIGIYKIDAIFINLMIDLLIRIQLSISINKDIAIENYSKDINETSKSIAESYLKTKSYRHN